VERLKAMGIAGSPRRDGNSAALLEAVLAGAADGGAACEVVRLNDLSFRGCQACRPCTPDATCRLDDELSGVLERLREADLWVLAAPIYFDGVSGQMKLFFDRLHHLINAAGEVRPLLTGRRAAAVVVTYEDKPRDDYRDVADRLAGYLSWMGEFVRVAVLAEGRLGPAGAAAARDDLMARARRVGRELVDDLTPGAAPGAPSGPNGPPPGP